MSELSANTVTKYLLMFPMAFIYMAMRYAEFAAKKLGKINDWYIDKFSRL